jgi:hypothetical protein
MGNRGTIKMVNAPWRHQRRQTDLRRSAKPVTPPRTAAWNAERLKAAGREPRPTSGITFARAEEVVADKIQSRWATAIGGAGRPGLQVELPLMGSTLDEALTFWCNTWVKKKAAYGRLKGKRSR